MRQDAPERAPGPPDSSDQALPARARAWGGIAVLVALMVSTSLAVAWFVSAWLVPPYLALMGAILFAPSERRNEAAEIQPNPRADRAGVEAEPGAVQDVAPLSTEPAASVDPSLEPSESSVAVSKASPVKTRRGKGMGKGRNKKAKGPFEPTDATWIRIGPGKFVRADTPGSSAPVGETSPTLPGAPDSPTPVPAFEAGREERTEPLGNEAGPAIPTSDEPADPPAPIVDQPSPECAEASPWCAPVPAVPAEEPIPFGKDDASEGAPEPEIAADERMMAGAEVIPPTMPEPLDVDEEPEPVGIAVAGPSEPEPVLPADEPTPGCAEASPRPAPESGLSTIAEPSQPHVDVEGDGDPELENVVNARAEDTEPGRAVEKAEDNGNAPDAPALDTPQAEPEAPSPSRPTGTLLRSLSLRGAWRPRPRTARGGRNAPSPTGRGARPSRSHRGILDLRLPARREPRRSRQPRRAFPPRSPPQRLSAVTGDQPSAISPRKKRSAISDQPSARERRPRFSSFWLTADCWPLPNSSPLPRRTKALYSCLTNEPRGGLKPW